MSAYPRRRVALRRARPLTLDRLEDRCTPAVFTVLNPSDAGPGSLRQAILDANALAGADSVVFDLAAFSSANTISLTTGTLTITDSLSVVGTGAGVLTLNAMQKRGLTIDGPGTLAVTISGLTLTNGSTTGDGGGISIANESVTLDHCTISHSTALGNGGGVWAGVGGSLIVTNCDIVGSTAFARGGGIYAACYTLLSESSVLDNSAGSDGGGVFIKDALLALTSTTVARNTTAGNGGGLAVDFVTGSYIVNATVSSNRAGTSGGGVYVKASGSSPVFDDFAIAQCTIAENRANVTGGGVWADILYVRFTNSITAKNVASRDSDLFAVRNQTIVRSAFGELLAVSFDLGVGAIPPGSDLKIGPLADNGGGRLTHALLPGSPCIDRGDLILFTDTDGRGTGFPRQYGLFPDIGAFETAGTAPNSPVALGQEYRPEIKSGGTSFEFRVDFYAEVGIDLATLDSSDIRVTGPAGFTTLAKYVGLQASQYSYPRTARYQFTPPGDSWDTSDYGRYSFSLEPGQVRDSAGANVPAGPLGCVAATFNRSVVTSDGDDGIGTLRYMLKWGGSGGSVTFDPAVFSTPRIITLSSGELAINRPVNIVGPGSELLTLDGSNNNRILNMQQKGTDTTQVSGVTFAHGWASSGAAIAMKNGQLKLSDAAFRDNKAVGIGGAISATGDSVHVSVDKADFLNNSADQGGAIYSAGSVDIRLSSFEKNVASGAGGGAVWCDSQFVYCNQSAFVANAALTGRGGAVYALGIAQYSSASFWDCTFASNSAVIGGAISLGAGGRFNYCTMVQNSASSMGGAIDTTSASISGCLLRGNISPSAPDVHSGDTVTLSLSSLQSFEGIAAGSVLQQNRPVGEDPLLGTLGNYGGRTMTVPLLPGSPCIDHGGQGSSTGTDQRGVGYPRRVGNANDIGAYEGVSMGRPVGQAASFGRQTVQTDEPVVMAVTYFFTGTFDSKSIDVGDVEVVAPDGAVFAPIGIRIYQPATGQQTVEYSIAPPHGVWSATDNGVFAAQLRPGQVYDSQGRSALPGEVGSFQVSIAAAIEVTSTADSGPGSLRAAILRANDQPGIPTPIVFNAAVFSTPRVIALTSGSLVITNTVTIAGPGAGLLTIDGGGGASRIFEWRQTWYQSSQLWGVTATRGNTTDVGGAMLVISRLRVRDCRFVDNNADQGGAIFGAPGSVLTVIRSTLSGNQARVTGGAISASSVTLDSCEIRDNRANTGGGITSFGNLTIRQSTISGNTAGGGDGGGVYSPEGVVAKFVLTNCTVSGNVAVGAGGGIAVTIGSIQLDNSTVAYNVAKNGGGGGIRVGSSYGTFIRSSVVALNSAVIDPDASMLGANSTANSLFGTIPNSMNGWTFILPVGTNPRLGPLADNGGPTRTHALLPDSPCINLGANSQILATDQGGLPRVVGSAPDIGAFEVQPVRVAGVTVNDGSAQRSRVTSLTVNFTGAVSLPAVPGDAFRLVRQYDGAAVAVQAKLLGNSAVLTFTGGPLEAGSLADGKYTLTVRGSQVLKGLLDGNGDGMPGDDFVLVGNPATNHLYRMFGDSNGDGIVNQTDLLAFRLALFSTNPTFNADGNGQVDLADFLRFRRNLFRMVP